MLECFDLRDLVNIYDDNMWEWERGAAIEFSHL